MISGYATFTLGTISACSLMFYLALIDTFSVSITDRVQGALLQEWQPLSRERNTVDRPVQLLTRREPPRARHDCVAVLEKDNVAIACTLRRVPGAGGF